MIFTATRSFCNPPIVAILTSDNGQRVLRTYGGRIEGDIWTGNRCSRNGIFYTEAIKICLDGQIIQFRLRLGTREENISLSFDYQSLRDSLIKHPNGLSLLVASIMRPVTSSPIFPSYRVSDSGGHEKLFAILHVPVLFSKANPLQFLS